VSTEDVVTVTISVDGSAFRGAMGAPDIAAAACPGLAGTVRAALEHRHSVQQFLRDAEVSGLTLDEANGILGRTYAHFRVRRSPFSIEDAYVRLCDAIRGSEGLSARLAERVASPLPADQALADRVMAADTHERVLQRLMADAPTAPLRLPGESRIDATERVLSSYSYGRDSASFDSRPEHCWRCDAKGAETDVGLCTPCHDDLRTP
jgi:hypothetical protein